MVLSAITKANYAQSQNILVFDYPEEKFRREFIVELDRSNKMQVSVTAMQTLGYLANIDSIVKVFTSDLLLIRDSLPTGSLSTRIDYNMDDPHIKKLRLTKTAPGADYYAVINGSPASLKMQQDTVVIHGRIPVDWLRKTGFYKEKNYKKYYFSVIFFLDDIGDLAAYRDGRLNEKIKLIRQYSGDKWQSREDETMQLKKYPEITANTAQGYLYHSQPFKIKRSIELQNYKDYFIPSISCTPTFIKQGDFLKREFGVSIEGDFYFDRQLDGVKTRINVFAGIIYDVTPVVKNPRTIAIYPYCNIAYLVHRSGDLYDKNTFRIGIGSFSLGNLTTNIQPAIYFNNFFKGVTPSLRIIQRF